VDEDRSQYQDAMATMSFETESLRLWRGGEQDAYPYVGGGLLAFLVFAAMAVRSTGGPGRGRTGTLEVRRPAAGEVR
jgi:hypothetical protein